jgi:hypothetical protein
MRRIVIPTVVSLLLTVPALSLASSAEAATVPTFGAFDTSTPGHVTGTVTTDAAYVGVQLRANSSDWGLDDEVIVPAGGVASYDLETWGLTQGWVAARPCTTASADSCGSQVVSASSFTPTDGIVPSVTWGADDTVGAGDVYQVTASDPDGGGKLYAVWDVQQYWGPEQTELTLGSPTTIPLNDDGAADLTVVRCSAFDWRICTSTATHPIVVNRRIGASYDQSWLGELNPTLQPLKPVITIDGGHNLSYEWWVTDYQTSQVVPGVGGIITGLEPDANGKLHPQVDASALTVNKNYNLMGTLSYEDPDFGTVTAQLNGILFRVDTVGTPITSISRTPAQLFPYRDNYRDSVAITVARPWDYVKMRLEILNANNTLVKAYVVPNTVSDQTFTWTGKNSAGQVVPAGTYHFRATLTDAAGNVTTKTQGSVTVVRKKVVSKTFSHTYSAAGSLIKKVVVGDCSTIASPSKRGWAGSLGLYSNAKCSKTFNDSIIETRHAVKVPAALKYGSLQVSMYGGAAREASRSIAYLGYISRNFDFTTPKVMMPSVGTHAGPSVAGGGYVFDDRSIGWDVFNVKGSRYDVKSFTVKLGYTTLVAD